MEQKNYYDILGVKKNASADEIKSAYKKLTKKWHPDRFANETEEKRKEAEVKMAEINNAYDILSNDEKRQRYDMFGDENVNGGFSGFGDNPFADFMGGFGFNTGSQNTRRVVKGSNVVINVHVTLKDIYNNVKKLVKYHRSQPCTACNGTGSADGQEHLCPHCNGTGMITQTVQRGFMTMTQSSPCPHCNGTGRTAGADKCHKCGGKGTEVFEESIDLDINIQWLLGQPLQVPGMGNVPKGNSKTQIITGDLIINPIVDNTEGFTIDNQLNVVKEVNVPIIDCLLGTTLQVGCLDDKDVAVKIRQGALDGDTYTIPNKGFNINGRKTNMIVVVRHKMPKVLNGDEKKTLESLKNNINFK